MMRTANDDDDYTEGGQCGYGNCKPKAMQRCANIKAYTANLSVILLFHIGFYSYFIGVMRTMEKRFGFRSSETGFLNSINDIIQTSIVLFVGYIGGKAHKPRFLGSLVVMTVIASVLYATPYFIYGGRDVLLTSEEMNATSSMQTTKRLCQSGGAVEDQAKCGMEELGGNLGSESKIAYIILALGCISIGFGGSSISTLGFSYIDENVPKKDSSLYIGITTSMYPWGPIVGFLLAGLCTSIPETLTATTRSKSDPNYIGAWWLGFLIIGLVIMVALIPLFFFPKHMKHYRVAKKSRLLNQQTAGDTMAVKETDGGGTSVLQQFKEFPGQFWKLITNKVFVLNMLSQTFSLYVVVGVLIQQPRYLEVHFHQPAHIASILAALSGATSGVCGNMLGGVLMRRFKLDKLGASTIVVLSMLIACVGTSISMLLPCPKTNMAGLLNPEAGRLVLDESCNMNCTCSTAIMQPVCAGNDVTFFSPCHAGCHVYMNGTFSDCSCVPAGVPVVPGVCETHCSTLIPYVVVYFIVTFFSLMGRVPCTILGFRVVEEHMRSFAFGFGSFLINLLTFIPGPILFGALVDSTCLIWQDKCGKTGACFFYDTDGLRLLPHGVTLAVQFFGFLLALITWILLKKGGAAFTIPHEDATNVINSHLNEDDRKAERLSTL